MLNFSLTVGEVCFKVYIGQLSGTSCNLPLLQFVLPEERTPDALPKMIRFTPKRTALKYGLTESKNSMRKVNSTPLGAVVHAHTLGRKCKSCECWSYSQMLSEIGAFLMNSKRTHTGPGYRD
jgi:hypothetical protein